jgi:murein DD-endopeptidase MepM/ murein hydrolase activator NlpD
MRSVVGALPPPSPRRPSRLRLRRRRPVHATTPPVVAMSARQFVVLAFCVWAALLAVLDYTMGRLRDPDARLVERLGRPEAPPVLLPRPRAGAPLPVPVPVQRGGRTLLPAARGGDPGAAAALSGILVPVAGVAREDLRDSFDEPRSGGRRHAALDILAPRNTPVLAAADGVVVKLFTSDAGGLTIYEVEPSGHYELYYAHLESYAPGVHEGDAVRQGQVIGYVGTSGNAPKDVPHLHFAIYRLGPDRRWWKGDALDPYPLLARAGGGVGDTGSVPK